MLSGLDLNVLQFTFPRLSEIYWVTSCAMILNVIDLILCECLVSIFKNSKKKVCHLYAWFFTEFFLNALLEFSTVAPPPRSRHWEGNSRGRWMVVFHKDKVSPWFDTLLILFNFTIHVGSILSTKWLLIAIKQFWNGHFRFNLSWRLLKFQPYSIRLI